MKDYKDVFMMGNEGVSETLRIIDKKEMVP